MARTGNAGGVNASCSHTPTRHPVYSVRTLLELTGNTLHQERSHVERFLYFKMLFFILICSSWFLMDTNSVASLQQRHSYCGCSNLSLIFVLCRMTSVSSTLFRTIKQSRVATYIPLDVPLALKVLLWVLKSDLYWKHDVVCLYTVCLVLVVMSPSNQSLNLHVNMKESVTECLLVLWASLWTSNNHVH